MLKFSNRPLKLGQFFRMFAGAFSLSGVFTTRENYSFLGALEAFSSRQHFQRCGSHDFFGELTDVRSCYARRSYVLQALHFRKARGSIHQFSVKNELSLCNEEPFSDPCHGTHVTSGQPKSCLKQSMQEISELGLSLSDSVVLSVHGIYCLFDS